MVGAVAILLEPGIEAVGGDTEAVSNISYRITEGLRSVICLIASDLNSSA